MFRFKKILSYLFDILLEEKSTELNPVLKLYLSNGQLKLATKGAVYSYGNLYDNFKESFVHIGIQKRKINDILILGLGTGSIIQLLEQNFYVQANYHAVEIDKEVVLLFEKYKSAFMQSSCTIYARDAFDFLQTNTYKYDLICMDIFCDAVVPEQFESNAFILSLKNALHEDGLLLYNRLAVEEDDKKRNENFFSNFQKIFTNARILKLKYNWMLVVDGNSKHKTL